MILGGWRQPNGQQYTEHRQQPRDPLEPLRQRNSIELPLEFGKLGGADRDRTGGLLVANQALSQLSYSPQLWSSITGD